MPGGEEVQVEAVTDEPWLAFNYYLGSLRSRIAVNLDLPIAGPELVELAAHETYPGHHTEHVWKEARLVKEQGRLEESIMLVPTPQSTVSEGIAEIALEVLGAEAPGRLAEVLAREGVSVDVTEASAIKAARDPLRWVGVNVALMLHGEGASVDDACAYAERWGVIAPEYAAKWIEFIRDPTWRAYVITYPGGRALCRAFVNGDPARLRRLLTEQIRVGELVEAAGGGAAVSSRG